MLRQQLYQWTQRHLRLASGFQLLQPSRDSPCVAPLAAATQFHWHSRQDNQPDHEITRLQAYILSNLLIRRWGTVTIDIDEAWKLAVALMRVSSACEQSTAKHLEVRLTPRLRQIALTGHSVYECGYNLVDIKSAKATLPVRISSDTKPQNVAAFVTARLAEAPNGQGAELSASGNALGTAMEACAMIRGTLRAQGRDAYCLMSPPVQQERSDPDNAPVQEPDKPVGFAKRLGYNISIYVDHRTPSRAQSSNFGEGSEM